MKLYYATMAERIPPRFLLFVNHRELCTQQYMHFLESRIREAFYPDGGVPVTLQLRARNRPSEGSRQAVAGIMKQKSEKNRALKRHRERQQGYRDSKR